MVHKLCLCLALFLGLLGTTVQADDAKWTVSEVVDISTLTLQPDEWINYKLSPDQTTLAWISRDGKQLCLFILSVKETSCIVLRDSSEHVDWSPNGRYLLLSVTSSYSARFYVYEPLSSSYTPFLYDEYLTYPLWDLSGDTLYFLSINEDTHGASLHRYSMLANADAVTDLGSLLPSDYWQSHLVWVSASGQQMIIQSKDHSSPALWLVDAQAQTKKVIASPNGLSIGVPSWYRSSGLIIEYSFWDRETDAVLVALGEGIPSHTLNVVRIEWKTGKLRPIFDYRNMPVSSDSYVPDLYHYESAITPDGAFLIYYGEDQFVNDTYHTPIYVRPLSADTGEPILVTDQLGVDCIPKPLLITLQRGSEIRAYTYRLIRFCPG